MEKILFEYYELINSKDIDAILTKMLSPNIYVTFQEKERNWRGLENAKAKFSKMYEVNPNFYGEILSVEEIEGKRISLKVFFGDKNEKEKQKLSKIMVYHFDENDKIIQIDH